MTRMQGWDYRLGINGVKRMQASYLHPRRPGRVLGHWTRT